MSRLKAFEAAVRLESFSLAARELNLTASAVSHQVKDLENYFGRPLFTRQNRRVKPTVEGFRFYQGLTRVFDALSAACADVALPAREQVLAVHCAPSFAVKWLGPRLPEFVGLHPEINIRLTTGAEPMDLTHVRDIDVAISYGFANERPGIEVLPLGDEQIAPLVSPMLLRADHSATEMIQSLTLIESQLSPVSWLHWFVLNRLKFSPKPGLSFDRAALAISAAADGMGVALESLRLAEREIGNGALVLLGPTEFDSIVRPTHFVCTRRNERDIDRLKVFVDWLLKEAGTTVPTSSQGANRPA